ncbi:tetraacyldisaccharide 4'-kinase [Acinetobacter qingfengensis]|uniref:Tetraacyldisaccharide 4'-kinase n=1 Tax=Acinetobacter qingfengensis TaxID=1262585 RepID=A0A1E7RF08_9GAMM|nr:tetraacyldisaccharide 4'-kinase [Acinetobacter qingfengensis]KAA8735653.1 tetraacyldisaccharide 4'-kinase [Acinetobacter qingfengensis]OEY97901.1 tetraacyldisaccharide 4'-kinase [Acinetobacter qingfengensis]
MNKLAEKLQQAWQDQASWLVMLRPLSYLYRSAFLLQKAVKQKKAYKAPVPVMIIGNITVGGSGKTPLIIALVEYLQQRHVHVGVISRGYGGQGPFPAQVTPQSRPSQVGDEPMLIVQNTHVPMTVGPNRQHAIDLLLKHYPETQLILSDDGLQHFALQRDIEWVVIDAMRGLGNQKLLPEGYLREPLSRLRDITVIEHHTQPQSSLNMHLQPQQPFCLGDQMQVFDASKTYQAVVGIGYPQRFFITLQQLNIQFQPCVFPDHHQYTIDDFQDFNQLPIITTAKDAVKLQELWHDQPERLKQVWVVPVKAKLSDACYQLLNQQLQQLNIEV